MNNESHRLRKWVVLLFTIQCSLLASMAQERCHYEAADSILIEQLLADGNAQKCDKGQDVLYFARKFLGKPYVAHTLELFPDDERLVLNTRELDCTTYVDIVVALTLCSRRGETTFRQFVHQLHMQRYWNGVTTHVWGSSRRYRVPLRRLLPCRR